MTLFQVCCSRNNQSVCDGTDSIWSEVPIIKHDNQSVTLSYKQNCSNQWIMGLRYEWRETPCDYKQCAVYSTENSLPAPPFITLGLIGGPVRSSAFTQNQNKVSYPKDIVRTAPKERPTVEFNFKVSFEDDIDEKP